VIILSLEKERSSDAAVRVIRHPECYKYVRKYINQSRANNSENI